MAVATHSSHATMVNDSNMSLEGMDWHGVYKDLLFRRGTSNPPCTHLKSDENAIAVLPETDLELRQSSKGNTNGIEGDQLPKDPASLIQDFLNDSPEARKRGCRNISRILRALGSAVDEFLLFLQEFEEGEDNEDVLVVLCNELKKFFDGPKDFRDKELHAAASHAFAALVLSCNLAEFLGNKVAFQVLELCEDKQSASRQTAAGLLPTLLHCTRRCLADILARQGAQATPDDRRNLETLLELKGKLFDSYIALCGDKSCSVQLAAGQQLPTFVDYVAAEVEMLQRGLPTQQIVDGMTDTDSVGADTAIGELMIAVYAATQKFALSLHESCRMQGVAAVAAMARRNAAAFRAIGNSFFPLLSSDSSWRVRATVCLALEDLAFLSCNSAPLSAEGIEVSKPDEKIASMTTSLFKFLSDRSPMVKQAALHLLPRIAQCVGNTAFVDDSWMLELHQIAEETRDNQGSRLPGACLDAVIALLQHSSGPQRRAFLELATDLAQRGNWKLKVSFLGSLGSLGSSDIEYAAPMISSSEFATDDDGEDCWRVQAALAQQLPVLLRTMKQADEKWWERATGLLLSPTWAVRQEAGFALRSIAEDECQQHQATPEAGAVLEQHLLRALQQQIWDYLTRENLRTVVLPMLQNLLNDPAPCCRLALVKLLGRLLQKDGSTQSDLADSLKRMMDTVILDDSAGVREEALELQRVLQLRLTPSVN